MTLGPATVIKQGIIEGVKKSLGSAHILQAKQLVKGKTAEEFKAVIGQAEKHLKIAIEADPENLLGKSELGYLYMKYANSLEEQSPERLEYLIKADKTFREIIESDIQGPVNTSIHFNITLGPSMQVRKQLAALDPKNYPIDAEVERVRTIHLGSTPVSQPLRSFKIFGHG